MSEEIRNIQGTEVEVRSIAGDQVRFQERTDLSIRAAFLPQTINVEERTVEAVLTTEAPVTGYVWSESQRKYVKVNEVLDMDPNSIRLGRLQSGTAPFLDNHNKNGSVTDNVLGVITAVRIEERKAIIGIRFSKREKPQEVFQDIQDGILKNVSVGYRVFAYRITEEEGQIPEYRAIDWEPLECSQVPIGADPNAHIRSNNNIFQPNTNTMPEGVEQIVTSTASNPTNTGERQVTPQVTEVATPPPAQDLDAIRAEAVRQENNRINGIREAARSLGLSEDFYADHLRGSTSLEEFYRLAIQEAGQRQETLNNTNTNAAVTGGMDERERELGALTGAILARSNQANLVITDQERDEGRRFQGDTFSELARRCLVRAGENPEGLSRLEMVGRSLTSSSSDFPILLAGTARRVLQAAFETIPDTWSAFCSVGSVSDFRVHSRLNPGSFSRLTKVNETQKYNLKAIPDAEQHDVYAETYGNNVVITRKMIINDDLGGFLQIPAMIGRAAALSIEQDVYSMFAENAGNGPTVTSDNVVLFHADHGNIGTGATISATSLDADATLMSQQKDVSGNDFLSINPYVLVVPRGLRGTAISINEAQFDPNGATLGVPNVSRGMFTQIVATPRLTGTTRYLFANPAIHPVFEVSFLNGQRNPVLETFAQQADQDGIIWKVRHDWGFGVVGYRGVVKNAGTT